MFDLTVQDNENFIVKGGFLSHNSARRSMSKANVDVTSFMAVSRHKGVSILFISQHSSLTENNIWRLSNCLIFKELSWEETAGKSGERVSPIIEYVRLMMPARPSQTLFCDGESWYTIETPLPSFWSEEISKSYKQLTWTEAVDMSVKLRKKGLVNKDILNQLKVRGVVVDNEELNGWLTDPVASKKALVFFDKKDKADNKKRAKEAQVKVK